MIVGKHEPVDKDDVLLAALQLVQQLDRVHKSPEYLSVWTLHQIHAGPYMGPTYTDALLALKKALKEPTDG